MAYTYNDFLKTVSAANMLGRFDNNDLEITKANPEYGLSMLSLMKDQDGASTPEARLLAGEAMNQLRANYKPVDFSEGVSDGTGTTKPPLPEAPATPTPETQQPSAGEEEVGDSFQYDREDEYQKLLAAMTNPGSFQYDYEEDPNWSAYRKVYLREGERATQDALARASAATGGIPSSYAITVAQQAGANYADQLAGLIPTLEQNAYSRFLNQQDMKLNALQVLQADRENEYARYLAEQELEAQREAAKKEPIAGEAGAPLGDGDLGYLKQTYPSGVISSKSTWDWLVAQYGEAALRAAGFQYQTVNTSLPDPAKKNQTTQEPKPVYFVGDWDPLAATNQLLDRLGVPAIQDMNPNYNGNQVDMPDVSEDTGYAFDESSIMALGLGPLSAEEVMRLVEDGIVEEYIEDGQIKLRLNTHAPFFTAGAAIRKP